MKKYFISLLMILAFGIIADAAAQHHRHHPSSSVNIKVSKDSSNVGITAYSDTTTTDSADSDTTDTDTVVSTSNNSNNDYDSSTPDRFFERFANSGFSMGAFSFLIAVVGIVAILSPIILVAVILYFIFRNRNQKYKLAQAAIAQGKSVPQELLREDRQTNEYLWSRGIRNASIGLGLVCMFWIIGAEPLIGVGLLVFFMGVGQAIIAKTTHKSERNKNEDFSQSRQSTEDFDSSFKMEDETPVDKEEPNSDEKTSEQK
jgi:hypothetical protein